MPPWALAARKPRGSAQSLRARDAHVDASLRVRGRRIGSCARILHLARGDQPEKSIKASTFDVRVAPSPAASQAHHEPKSSP